MIPYPLSIPLDTLYDLLGVGPEATGDDINEAKSELVSRLRAEVHDLERKLAAVDDAVPGLREATEEARALESQTDAAPEAVQAARLKLERLRQKAALHAPLFRRWLEQAQARKRLENEVNTVGLDNAEERRKYDDKHPPLGLLRLADCTSDALLAEPRAALQLLREELTRFLAARGEEVFHPSDLSRDDFRGDFLPCPYLDGADDEQPV